MNGRADSPSLPGKRRRSDRGSVGSEVLDTIEEMSHGGSFLSAQANARLRLRYYHSSDPFMIRRRS